MHSKSNRASIRDVIGDQKQVHALSKLLLAATSTVLVLYVVTLLPGLDLLFSRTHASVEALASAVATVAAVALLYYLASGLAALVRELADGPATLVENGASVVYWSVVLVAVLVAHRGFEPAVAPVLGDAVWVYHGAFLLAALAPLSFVVAVLYVSLDPAADLIADRVVTDGAGSPPVDGDEVDRAELRDDDGDDPEVEPDDVADDGAEADATADEGDAADD